MDEIKDGLAEVACDVLVIGGGAAGPMAAYKAKMRSPKSRVVLLEKANVRRSGAIAMGMDGLNNAVIPGYATLEQYVKEITIANDGVVDQAPVLKYAERCYSIIEELDRFGIRFQKTENGDFDAKKVHHLGAYVLPMPNGDTVKKAPYRQLRREQVLISNRFMATRLLKDRDGRIAGVIAVNARTAELLVVRAKTVILCMGAAGRLGLPQSGYLWGTYENAANSGDGYAMAYHAGTALANLECYQINPLIKDYNGPACAYVAGPFGAYTTNAQGARFIECDYWSGQMMQEFYNELQSGKGPVFLKLGLDYEAQLKHYAQTPLKAKDAATGEDITDFARVAQIWVKGEPLVRHYGSPEGAFEALSRLETEGKEIRVVYAQDRQSGIKLFGAQAWYVAEGDGKLSAFLLKVDAEKWAAAHGGRTLDYARARAFALASR